MQLQEELQSERRGERGTMDACSWASITQTHTLTHTHTQPASSFSESTYIVCECLCFNGHSSYEWISQSV